MQSPHQPFCVASAGQADDALKAMAQQLSKSEKIIAEMRDAYAKTKKDAEETINAREEEVSKLTAKVWGVLSFQLDAKLE